MLAQRVKSCLVDNYVSLAEHVRYCQWQRASLPEQASAMVPAGGHRDAMTHFWFSRAAANMCSTDATSPPSCQGFPGKRILEQAVGLTGIVLEGQEWLRGHQCLPLFSVKQMVYYYCPVLVMFKLREG